MCLLEEIIERSQTASALDRLLQLRQRRIQVGGVEHEHGRLAAQLQPEALHAHSIGVRDQLGTTLPPLSLDPVFNRMRRRVPPWARRLMLYMAAAVRRGSFQPGRGKWQV